MLDAAVSPHFRVMHLQQLVNILAGSVGYQLLSAQRFC